MSLTIKNNEYLIKIPCSCRRMRSVCVAIHLYAGLAAIALLRLRVLCRALSRALLRRRRSWETARKSGDKVSRFHRIVSQPSFISISPHSVSYLALWVRHQTSRGERREAYNGSEKGGKLACKIRPGHGLVTWWRRCDVKRNRRRPECLMPLRGHHAWNVDFIDVGWTYPEPQDHISNSS